MENMIRSAPTAVMAFNKSGVEKWPDVLLEVVSERILHRQPLVPVMPDHPAIDTPKMAWSHFSEMSNHELDSWEAVEDTVGAHPQDMALHVLPEL